MSLGSFGQRKSLLIIYAKLFLNTIINRKSQTLLSDFFEGRGGAAVHRLGRKGQENVFGDILERKNAFLDYKDRRFIKSKIGIILKRLVHGFCQETAIFPFFLFSAK